MRIAILSRNPKLYSTNRLIEATTAAGHQPVLLDHTKCYVSIERAKPSIHYGGKEVKDIEAVIPRIGASVTFYGTAIVRQFEMMRIFSANESQAIVRSRDKLRSLQLLSRAGLGIPKTVFADNSRNVDDLIKMVGGTPLVVKLLEGTQGIGVVLAETNSGAKSIIEAFLGQDIYILVQEFIKEANGLDIRALVIDGKVVGAMKRQGKDGEFRSNLHRGGSGTIVNLSVEEELSAIRAAEVLGLKIAGVDMLRSSRGPMILEVNSSPGLKGIEQATGIDIAGKIVEFVSQNARRKEVQDKIGV
ncbi:MAG TPA: 30S ribosomal protein S6--L-glutamate ligase [Chitinophagales bacterium]|nr:30S ribosomal protein S6--L-glutamate ligase [Chitinophagales bacterium]